MVVDRTRLILAWSPRHYILEYDAFKPDAQLQVPSVAPCQDHSQRDKPRRCLVHTIKSPVGAGSLPLPHFRARFAESYVCVFQEASSGRFPCGCPPLMRAKAHPSLCFLGPPRRRTYEPPPLLSLPMRLLLPSTSAPPWTFAAIGVAVVAASCCCGLVTIRQSIGADTAQGGSRPSHPPGPCGARLVDEDVHHRTASNLRLLDRASSLTGALCVFPCGRYSPWPSADAFPVSDTLHADIRSPYPR